MEVPLPKKDALKVSLLVLLLVPANVCFAVEAGLLPVHLFPSVMQTLSRGGDSGGGLSTFRALVISATAHIKVKGLINIMTTVSTKNTKTMF